VTQHVWDEDVRIPISPLMSGVAYAFEIGTTSYGMKGDRYNVTIRTRKFHTNISEILVSSFSQFHVVFQYL